MTQTPQKNDIWNKVMLNDSRNKMILNASQMYIYVYTVFFPEHLYMHLIFLSYILSMGK